MNCLRKTSKRILCGLFTILISSAAPAQPNLGTKNGKITFFSSTPVEDIKAASDKLSAVWVTKTQEIAFQVPIRSFKFAKGLMQEHFNENYMESDKYPYAGFKGKAVPEIDMSKDGTYPVKTVGTLTVHGVSKHREIPGKITVKEGKARITTSFDAACADHNIKIPTLIITKVAEVINVKVDALLSPLNQ